MISRSLAGTGDPRGCAVDLQIDGSGRVRTKPDDEISQRAGACRPSYVYLSTVRERERDVSLLLAPKLSSCVERLSLGATGEW